MAVVKVKCPYCGSDEVSLFGKNRTERQGICAATKRADIRHFSWNIKLTHAGLG